MSAAKRKPRESFGRLRKTSAGRWHASYMGPDNERHNAPATFNLVTDARLWLAGQHRDIAHGVWTAPGEAKRTTVAARVTLDEYAREWIETRTNRHGESLRPRTRAEYLRLLDSSLADLAPKPLNAITPEVVRSWYRAIEKSGTKTTAARAYTLLKSMLGTAVEDGRIKSNPCMIRGGAMASTGKHVEPPTPAQLQTILDSITPRYRAAVQIAAWGGLRFGELTELRRKDLTIVEHDGDRLVLVNVARAVTHTAGVGFTIGKTKSAAGVRAIPLPPDITPTVEAHLRDAVATGPNALLYPAADGVTHLAESTLAKHWYPAREAAGRSDMPWHALRHYGATRAALAGATLKELQARLGHSTVAAAMRYQHTAGRELDLARRMTSGT